MWCVCVCASSQRVIGSFFFVVFRGVCFGFWEGWGVDIDGMIPEIHELDSSLLYVGDRHKVRFEGAGSMQVLDMGHIVC